MVGGWQGDTHACARRFGQIQVYLLSIMAIVFLQVQNVSKAFGEEEILNEVGFQVREASGSG